MRVPWGKKMIEGTKIKHEKIKGKGAPPRRNDTPLEDER